MCKVELFSGRPITILLSVGNYINSDIAKFITYHLHNVHSFFFRQLIHFYMNMNFIFIGTNQYILEIGRASCREKVYISEDVISVKEQSKSVYVKSYLNKTNKKLIDEHEH